jgi:hypothetical protein
MNGATCNLYRPLLSTQIGNILCYLSVSLISQFYDPSKRNEIQRDNTKILFDKGKFKLSEQNVLLHFQSKENISRRQFFSSWVFRTLFMPHCLKAKAVNSQRVYIYTEM